MILKKPINWRYLSFKESGVSLIDCDHRTPPPSDHGFPYVAIPQIKEGHIDLNDVRLISHEHFLEWTKKAKPQSHDIVLSRRCNPGETGYVRPGLDFALGQNLVLLRSNNTEIYPQFLRWLVRGPEWWDQIAKFLNVGAVFDSLKCADIPNFQFSIPPLPTQKAIAHILGTLDDKIELNRQMNETLESIARAIFTSWFIDFDPVRAKADGKQPEGMDAATAALFPSEFETVEGQEIPKGWKYQSLGSISEEIFDYRGKTPKKLGFDWSQEGIVAISAKNIKNGRFINQDDVKFVSDELYKKWMKSDLKKGDILITSEAPCGELLYLHKDWQLCLSQRLFCVRPDINRITPGYLYYSLCSDHIQYELSSRETGTTVTGIRQSLLRTVPVLTPPLQLLMKIELIFSTILDKIHQNEDESRILSAYRDTLLPKLLSGELPITNPEQFTGVS